MVDVKKITQANPVLETLSIETPGHEAKVLKDSSKGSTQAAAEDSLVAFDGTQDAAVSAKKCSSPFSGFLDWITGRDTTADAVPPSSMDNNDDPMNGYYGDKSECVKEVEKRDKNGKLISKQYLDKDGNVLFEKEFDKNGRVTKTWSYAKGGNVGFAVEYNPDGSIKQARLYDVNSKNPKDDSNWIEEDYNVANQKRYFDRGLFNYPQFTARDMTRLISLSSSEWEIAKKVLENNPKATLSQIANALKTGKIPEKVEQQSDKATDANANFDLEGYYGDKSKCVKEVEIRTKDGTLAGKKYLDKDGKVLFEKHYDKNGKVTKTWSFNASSYTGISTTYKEDGTVDEIKIYNTYDGNIEDDKNWKHALYNEDYMQLVSKRHLLDYPQFSANDIYELMFITDAQWAKAEELLKKNPKASMSEIRKVINK